MVILFRETWAFYHGGGGSSGHANSVGGGAGGSGQSSFPKSEAYLKANFSKLFALKALGLIKVAPEPVQKLWEGLADKLGAYGGTLKDYTKELKDLGWTKEEIAKQVLGKTEKSAFFSSVTGKIYFDENLVMNGMPGKKPFTTFFHESAHAMDALIANTVGSSHKMFTDMTSAIEKALIQDYENLYSAKLTSIRAERANLSLIERIGLPRLTTKYVALELAKDLKKEFPNIYDRHEMSDMLAAAMHLTTQHTVSTTKASDTQIWAPLDSGHAPRGGSSYWSKHGGSTEPWAELTAVFTNPGARTAIESKFPATVSAYSFEVDRAIQLISQSQTIK